MQTPLDRFHEQKPKVVNLRVQHVNNLQTLVATVAAAAITGTLTQQRRIQSTVEHFDRGRRPTTLRGNGMSDTVGEESWGR